MKTGNLLIVLAAIFSFPDHLLPQERKHIRAVVFTANGTGTSGYLSEIRIGRDDDTLVLTSAKHDKKVLISDLSRVIILPSEVSRSYFLAGALTGTYFSTLLIGQSDAQPAGFLWKDFSSRYGLLGIAFLGTAVGVGVDELSSFVSNDERELVFNQDDQQRTASRRTLYDIFSGEKKYPKIHCTVQGGHVFGRNSREFRDITSGMDDVDKGATEFTMVRKAQVTYSIQPDVEIGAAVVWSSEPSVPRYGWTYDQPTKAVTTLHYDQSLNIVGYYGVGKYRPLYSGLPLDIDIALGGGFGIAAIDYSRSAVIRTDRYAPAYTSGTAAKNTINEKTLSVFIFGECSYYLYEYLSLGIIADHVLFFPQKVPAEPAVNLPEQTIYGNACIGFVLGLHL